jgi:hypothetical protein
LATEPAQNAILDPQCPSLVGAKATGRRVREGDALREVYETLREARSQQAPEPASADPQPLGRVLYRIVHAPGPTAGDFTSNLAKCLPMRGAEPEEPLLWAGLSMFDTPEAAMRNARRFYGKLGAFLAELHLPVEADARILIRQTLRPGHFTVLCCEATCISLVHNVQRQSDCQVDSKEYSQRCGL